MNTLKEKTLRKDRVLRELASGQPLSLRIQGNCMYPLLKDGAAVQVKSKRLYWPGDVLVFRGNDNQVCIHRFLSCYLRHGCIRYMTKADTALRPDSSVERHHIIGKVCGGDGSPKLSAVPLSHRLRAFGCFLRFAVQRLTRNRFTNGVW